MKKSKNITLGVMFTVTMLSCNNEQRYQDDYNTKDGKDTVIEKNSYYRHYPFYHNTYTPSPGYYPMRPEHYNNDRNYSSHSTQEHHVNTNTNSGHGIPKTSGSKNVVRKCIIINNWLGSYERANIVIKLPSGKSITIKKSKIFSNTLTEEQNNILFKILNKKGEFELLINEIELLQIISKI